MQTIGNVTYIKDVETLREEYEKAQEQAKQAKKDYDELNEYHGRQQDESDLSSTSDEVNEQAAEQAFIDLNRYKERANDLRRELRNAGGTRDSDPRGLDTPSDSDEFDYGAKSESEEERLSELEEERLSNDSHMDLGEPINVTESKPEDSDGDSGSEGNNGDNSDGGVGLPVENEGDSFLPDAQSAPNWSETLRGLWETLCALLESIFL